MSVLLWLAVIEVLGVIAFPVAFVTLRPLRDRGYSVAKPLGLLLMAYPPGLRAPGARYRLAARSSW